MIYIGTSGFSYDDWKGEFYPPGTDKKKMLRLYAQSFNAVEINSTYYAIPGAASFASMERKTPRDFKFVVKAHKDMTHANEPVQASFDSFLGAIQPLQDTGKLGCILAQFPWGFKPDSANMDKLCRFKEQMGELPTVVEFRNADWVKQDTFSLLKQLNLGLCSVDEPQLKGLMPRVAVATSDIGYIRFHGRNAQQWWKHEESYERYNYLYSEGELAEWVPKAEDIQRQTSDLYVFFNNHFRGKSAQNARQFAAMLGAPLPAEPPAQGQLTLGGEF